MQDEIVAVRGHKYDPHRRWCVTVVKGGVTGAVGRGGLRCVQPTRMPAPSAPRVSDFPRKNSSS